MLVFIFNYFSIYSSSNIPVVPALDYVNYANLSNFLSSFGRENSSINAVFPYETSVSTYHYFEMWLTVGFTSLYRCNTMLTLILITFSIGAFVIWAGFCALFSRFKSIRISEQFLSFLFLFVTGISTSYFEQFPFFVDSSVFTLNALCTYKLFPIYWFVIASLLFFYEKDNEKGILILLCVPIASISTGVGIWSAIFIYLIFYKLVLKKDGMVVSTFTIILLTIFTFAFYKVLGKHTQTHIPNSDVIISKIIEHFNYKTSINIIGKTTIQIFFLYSPFIFLFFLIFRKKDNILNFVRKNSFVQIFILIFIISLVGWSAMFMMLSTVQVFCNIGDVILNLFCVSLIISGFASKIIINRWAVRILFSFIIGVNIYFTFHFNNFQHSYSTSYLKKIDSVSSLLSPIGAFIMDKSDYNSIGFSYVSNFAILGKYLAYSNNKTFPVSISQNNFEFFGTEFAREYQKGLLDSSPFSEYMTKLKQKSSYKNIEQSRISFINDYKINYLIITKYVKLDSLLAIRVSREIKDNTTGERFLLLKYAEE